MKSGAIDAVIVGADRIAANGDVANKIGTYMVAVLAARHNIPFYVAAPLSTFDLSAASGDAINLYQNGVECSTIYTTRKDGPDGDSTYNPYGLANRGFDSSNDIVPFTYRMKVPIVKGGFPLTILARTDGSAENILLKLDGGVDLNGTVPSDHRLPIERKAEA